MNRRRPLYQQPNKAARIARGVAVFIVALAFAALISVDDWEPQRTHEAR